MKLKKISAVNFKGLSFELELADMTVLVGDNFAGKTARTDLIRWVLLGYLPELGKRNSDTFGLSSGREMTGVAEFDNGMTIRRRLYLKGDSVKEEVECPDEIAGCPLMDAALNADSYFQLSDRERVNYVFANLPQPEEILPSKIRQRIVGEQPELTELVDRIFPDACMLTTGTQAFIEAAALGAAEEAKKSREYAVRMEKTVQGLAGLRAADTTPVAGPAGDPEALARELADVSEQITTLNKRQSEAEQIGARRVHLEKLLAELASNERELAERKAALAALPAAQTVAPSVADMRVEAADLSGQIRHSDANLMTCDKGLRDLERDLSEIDSKTECPYCGASGDGWKDLKAAELATSIHDIEERRTEIVKAKGTLQAALKAKDADIAAAKATEARESALAHQREALARLVQSLELSVSRAPAYRDELAQLFEKPLEVEWPAEITRLRDRKAQLSKALDGIRDAMRAQAQRQADLKRLAEAETARDKAKAEQAQAAALADLLRKIQAESVERAFKPMLEIANAFVRPVLKTPLAYNPEGGEIGTWRGGVWVTHRTMSGTEKAIAYAAIQAALASRAPVRLMLIDELGRLGDKSLKLLLQAVHRGIMTGLIDGFVGIDTGRSDLYHEFAMSWMTDDFALNVAHIQ
jgi:predicted  nucleic acid-binding Zn-ribbon protein